MTTKKKMYISASAILLLIVIGTALGIATNEGAFTTVTSRSALPPPLRYNVLGQRKQAYVSLE